MSDYKLSANEMSKLSNIWYFVTRRGDVYDICVTWFAVVRSSTRRELVYVIFKGGEDALWTVQRNRNNIAPAEGAGGTTIRCNKVYTGSCNSDGCNTAKSALSTSYRCKLYAEELWRWKRILTIGNNMLPSCTRRSVRTILAIIRSALLNRQNVCNLPRNGIQRIENDYVFTLEWGRRKKKNFKNSVRRLSRTRIHITIVVINAFIAAPPNLIFASIARSRHNQFLAEIDHTDRIPLGDWIVL